MEQIRRQKWMRKFPRHIPHCNSFSSYDNPLMFILFLFHFSYFINSAIPRMILYTRVTNLVLSVCMILASLLSLLTTESATTGVLACYVVVFSCLLCCFETHLKQIAKIIALNFGFMYSAKSRCAFMIFVGE